MSQSRASTNFPWLGEYPNHWQVRPLWTMFRRVKRVGFEAEELLSVYRDFGVVPKASRDDNFNKPSEDLSAYQLVESGDLVINKMKAWQGSVAISHHRGIVSPAYFVYTPFHDANPTFLHYLFRSPPYIAGYLSLSKGIRVNQWDLEPQVHSRIPVLLPPILEQRLIASFLDQETSKIDALISEQQRLIELLKEKRQAVISHAVTKGLNPDVRMKPSGVEWLGEVPEHWSLIPLKHCVKLSTDKAEESSFPVALENVQSWTGTFVPGEGDFSGEGVAFQAGDILFGKLRPYLAKAFLADKAGEAVGDFHVLRPHAGVFGRWLQYRILSREFIAEINSASFGSKMPRVSWEFMGRMPIPLPPMAEQQAVAHKLNSELAVIDELVVDADKSIALLQERRTALISAAVTGKIDVRNYAATQKDAA
jgi:type I restriction enzyme S subunit